MHEHAITCSIIEILEEIIKKNNLSKVNKVSFEISPVASIEPDSIRFYFEFLTKDNCTLKGADLDFRVGSMELQCIECNISFKTDKFKYKCPECGSRKIRAAEMDDLKIISVESDK